MKKLRRMKKYFSPYFDYLDKQDKKTRSLLTFSVFGLIFFLAIALTLPLKGILNSSFIKDLTHANERNEVACEDTSNSSDFPTTLSPKEQREMQIKLKTEIAAAAQELKNDVKDFDKPGKSKQEKKDKIKQNGQKRKNALAQLMRQNPGAARDLLLSGDDLNQANDITEGCVERETKVEGTIEVMHGHNGKDYKGVYAYSLVTDDKKRIHLHQTTKRADNLASANGKKMVISGHQLGNDILISDVRDSNVQGANTKKEVLQATSAPLRPVVIMIRPTNMTWDSSWTQQRVRDVVFTTPGDYLRESSYGKISGVSGDVYGPFDVPAVSSACDVGSWGTNLPIVDPNIDFSKYNQIMWVGPWGSTTNPNSCDWAALGGIGQWTIPTAEGNIQAGMSWYRTTGYFDWKRVTHEIVHTLGHGPHDNFTDCGSTSLGPSGCKQKDYEGFYDVLGYGAEGQITAPVKDHLNWFSSTQIKTLTSSGNYQLEPYATNSQNLKVLKIPRVDGKYIYIEYRRPIGFDTWFSSQNAPSAYTGASIHLNGAPFLSDYKRDANGNIEKDAYGNPIWIDRSQEQQLIEASPPGDWKTAALQVGQQITDPQTGTVIKVTDRTDSLLTVQVVMNGSPLPSGSPSSWQFCANEGAQCSFSGTRQVRYGAEPYWATGTYTSSVTCNNATFGDPYPNNAKHCEYSTSTVAPTNIPTPTPTNSPTPTPTRTPTPVPPTPTSVVVTQPPAGSTQILQNANFDAGSANWIEQSAGSYPIIVTYAPEVRSAPNVAWLNGVDNTTDAVYQDVTIPSNATSAVLSYWLKIESSEDPADPNPYDTFKLEIRNTANAVLATPHNFSNVNRSGYTERTVDLIQYRGQTIRIAFQGSTDPTLPTSFYVDDTALMISGTSTVTPPPTSTPLPTATPTRAPTAFPTATPLPSDTTPPSVSITSPTNGSTVTRNSYFTINASASDNIGVARVDFYVDGAYWCQDATAPYSCSVKITGTPNSSHTLQVRAYDSRNNMGTGSIQVQTTR